MQHGGYTSRYQIRSNHYIFRDCGLGLKISLNRILQSRKSTLSLSLLFFCRTTTFLVTVLVNAVIVEYLICCCAALIAANIYLAATFKNTIPLCEN